MKKKFFLFALFTSVALFAATPVGASGQVTLNIQYAGKAIIGLSGTGQATIDWGDGTRVETYTLQFAITPFSHNYSNATPRTVTITGENIRGLVCQNMGITNLDVTKITTLSVLDCSRNKITSLNLGNNTDLRHLTCSDNLLTTFDVSQIEWLGHIRCSNNQITNLNVSKNRAIKSFFIDNNKLNRNEMENFLRSLHANVPNGGKVVDISNNPAAGANAGIARDSGWSVTN